VPKYTARISKKKRDRELTTQGRPIAQADI
jgi:hypothetical protein